MRRSGRIIQEGLVELMEVISAAAEAVVNARVDPEEAEEDRLARAFF